MKEHKKMAPERLVAACQQVLEEWHRCLSSRSNQASDSFIACAGIKVAELSRTKWPLQRTDYVSNGSRFRSTGPFIQGVLKRFGEEREYSSEGGRTTGSCLPAAADLIERLEKLSEYQKASAEDRSAVANSIQEWIYKKIVRPSLDHEGLKVEISLQKIPPDIVADILAAATKQGVSGAVAQHLVGAKLALRYPEMKIENYGHTTQDKQLGRKGDFELNDTVIHVTMTPGEAVAAKCAKNVGDGFNPLLLVPRSEVSAAESFVRRSTAANRIWVESIEAFVGQNIAEIGEFGKNGFRESIKRLLSAYNERVNAVEPRKALMIKVPENL
jgi:hypothetical protein